MADRMLTGLSSFGDLVPLSLSGRSAERNVTVDTSLLPSWYATHTALRTRIVEPPELAVELEGRLATFQTEWEATATLLFSRMIALEQRLSHAQAPSQWFNSQLIEMVGWGPGWDGGSARAIEANVAKRASTLATQTAGIAGEPEPIPAADGSIQLVWTFSTDRYASTFLEPDGPEVGTLVVVDAKNAPKVIEFSGPHDLARVLSALVN